MSKWNEKRRTTMSKWNERYMELLDQKQLDPMVVKHNCAARWRDRYVELYDGIDDPNSEEAMKIDFYGEMAKVIEKCPGCHHERVFRKHQLEVCFRCEKVVRRLDRTRPNGIVQHFHPVWMGRKEVLEPTICRECCEAAGEFEIRHAQVPEEFKGKGNAGLPESRCNDCERQETCFTEYRETLHKMAGKYHFRIKEDTLI